MTSDVRWVPHTIRCKCGLVIAGGYSLETGLSMTPLSITEIALCDACKAKDEKESTDETLSSPCDDLPR